MEEKIEIENALRLARGIMNSERRPTASEPFQPMVAGGDTEEASSQTMDNSQVLESIRRRGLEVVRRL